MFAAEENLTPPAEADVDADEAAHPFVTWRTKEFMWSLHSKDPHKWDARSISEQFGVKLPQVRTLAAASSLRVSANVFAAPFCLI
jgi:hypothetical protein